MSFDSLSSNINSECIGWNTAAKNVTNFNIATSGSWAAPYNGLFFIQMTSYNDTAHDAGITLGGVQVASQYFVYKYQRLNAYLPLRKGTALAFTGNNDNIFITCMTGVFNP